MKEKNQLLFIGNYFSNTAISYEILNYLRHKGWVVKYTSTKKNRVLRLIDMLFTIVIENKNFQVAHVDVFSGFAFFWALCCVYLLKLFSKAIILTLHGGNLPEFSRKYPFLIRVLFKNANVITVPSRYLLFSMKEYYPDLFLIPNPINIKKFEFLQRRRIEPNLIWLRAFHEIYNPTLAPKLVAILKKRYPDIKLLMIGADKADGSLQNTKKLSEDLSLTKHIDFIGMISREDVPNWLNKGDILINTTNIDNTPISILEAMAVGLCIISTNVGGIPHLLENEKDALLVPPDNPEDMANAIHRVLSDSELAKNLSINARKKVEKFDWEEIYPLWEKLLRNINDSKPNHYK